MRGMIHDYRMLKLDEEIKEGDEKRLYHRCRFGGWVHFGQWEPVHSLIGRKVRYCNQIRRPVAPVTGRDLV